MIEEILQNCRRAGATRVEIIQTWETENILCVTIKDNGCGIEDPSVLLCLGGSDWNEETQRNEIPAGMGFFAVCVTSEKTGYDVAVRSKDWYMSLTSAMFRGKETAEALQSPPIEGTSVTFRVATQARLLHNSATSQSMSKTHSQDWIGWLRFYPFELVVDGEVFAPMDFMQDMTHVVEHPHCRIGFKVTDSDWRDQLQRLPFNFHGLQIRGQKFNHAYDETFRVFGSLKPYKFYVDVKTSGVVDLLLPKRDEIIENEKMEALKALCRKELYEWLVTTNTPHDLEYVWYQEAHSMGIQLPEARPRGKTPCIRNAQDSVDSELHAADIIDTSNSWVSREVKPDDIQADEMDFAEILLFAINRATSNFFERLVEVPRTMKGYSWYPKQELTWKKNDCIQFSFNGEEFDKEIETGEFKTLDIKIRLVGTENTEDVEEIVIPAWFVFETDGDAASNEFDQFAFIASRKSDLRLELLQSCFFYYYEDSEDSYDDQIVNFNRGANVHLRTLLMGDKQALKQRVLDEVEKAYELREAAALANVREVRITMLSKNNRANPYRVDIVYPPKKSQKKKK